MTTTHNIGGLAIKHFVSPDGNPFNPDRIQVSSGSRGTENDAMRIMMYGLPIPAPHINIHSYNGQVVDQATMLMCSRCCTWKADDKFAQDRTRIIRRGRRYYCKDCHNRMRH